MEGDNLGLWLICILGLYLICQRWFWFLVFGVSTLASGFACIASIIHFHILGALGFFFLGWVLLEGTGKIIGDSSNEMRKL